MNKMREQWLDHGISDIDYIRYLEKQINVPQEHYTCEDCIEYEKWKHNYYPTQCRCCSTKPRTNYFKPKSTE